MFKDLKIRTKLLLSFGATTSVLIVGVAITSHVVTTYKNAAASMSHADQLKASLEKEQRGVLMLLGGFEGGPEEYIQARDEISELHAALSKEGQNRREPLLSLVSAGQRIDQQFFAEGFDFFERYGAAQAGLVAKNSESVSHLLHYKEAWTVPQSAEADQVLNLLDSLTRERTLAQDFNQGSIYVEQPLQDFQSTSDNVVAGLVQLWQHQLDLGLSPTPPEDLRLKSQALSRTVAQITASSFPPVPPEDAALMGIPANNRTLFGLDAVHATTRLTNSWEGTILIYEQTGGAPLWARADVPTLGKGATPTLVLGSLVSHQQALRLNGEEIFYAQAAYANDIRPTFAALSSEIDLFRSSTSYRLEELGSIVRFFSLTLPVTVFILVILLVVLMSRNIARSISVIRDAAVDVAGGNLSRRAEVLSNDEVGILAASFNNMAENLEKTTVSKNYVDNIVSSMLDMLIVASPDGVVRSANSCACATLGYTEAEMIGIPLSAVLEAPEDRDVGIISSIMAGAATQVEKVFISKAGTQIPVSFSGSVMQSADGEVEGIVCVAQDISDRKQVEHYLRETGRMAFIGELAAGVAHEINNPLTSVLGFSDLLLEEDDVPEHIQEDLQRIYTEAKKASKIVTSLMSLASKSEPLHQYLDLNPILERTMELKSYDFRTGNIQLVCDLTQEVPHIMGSEHQLIQVFLNILNNAEQAMRASREGSQIIVRSTNYGSKVRISIEDEGPGIRPEHLDRIFDPFFTTKQVGVGSGLGLSLCYGIIRQHSGVIWAESTLGKGTTFHIELPSASPRPEPPVLDSTVTDVDSGTPKHLLIVDDEPTIRDLLVKSLDNELYTVDLAESGQEAWRKVQSRWYDSVIMDLHMPGMSGPELYRRIKDHDHNLAEKVIFITGSLYNSDISGFVADAGNPTLVKPFQLEELRSQIRMTLRDDAQLRR